MEEKENEEEGKERDGGITGKECLEVERTIMEGKNSWMTLDENEEEK